MKCAHKDGIPRVSEQEEALDMGLEHNLFQAQATTFLMQEVVVPVGSLHG